MVSLPDVRAHNATLKSLPAGLVAVFVGGTSGIGFFTARELVRNTTSPHVYLVGRNATEASKITEELRSINTSSQISFIQKDVSLLKNVDEACKEIKAREKQVNILFMTCGYLTLKGRDETSECLDRKFALHYYTRMRFIQQLTPLLTASAQANTLSRVVAVLDPQPGLRFTPNFSDLSLKSNFSLKNCMVHASAMGSLSAYYLAKEQPNTTFIHAYPSGVDTGALRQVFGRFEPAAKLAMGIALRWLMVPQKESGERHLFAATAPRYAPKAAGASVEGAAVGSDGIKGSGSYLLNWNGEILADRPTAKKMRGEGKEKVVWQHTEEVFNKICDEGGKY
ncbi:Nn.00g034060.m01.CDS01 [Neocucurbitaria sp. VM-36]